MKLCTWAPTVFEGPQLARDVSTPRRPAPWGPQLQARLRAAAQRIEDLGLSHLLIAQRYWGSGREMEGASLDASAATAFFASCTSRLRLVTAIHPGFHHPSTVAKWGATMDHLSGGRWSINVTSGWHLREFEMYGVDPLEHDLRYVRSGEFIDVLRGAWSQRPFRYEGRFYSCHDLELEPRPRAPLEVFQGGQSEAALRMAGRHSDWMYLNGGHTERIRSIIKGARTAAQDAGRTLSFCAYAAPLCRATDEEAWAEIDSRLSKLDPTLVERRRAATSGAEGMWGDEKDPLSHLDTNEGYATRLIGSPETILERVQILRELGVDMLHLDLRDELFVTKVLPQLVALE